MRVEEHVSRRLVNLTLDNLGDIAPRCRSCVFWELDPVSGRAGLRAGRGGAGEGSLGIGHPARVGQLRSAGLRGRRRSGLRPLCPAGLRPALGIVPDVTGAARTRCLLMTARLDPEFRGGGLGRMLVQAVARDISRRGIRAVEAFGRTGVAARRGRCRRAALPAAGRLPARRRLQDRAPTPANTAAALGHSQHRVVARGRGVRLRTAARFDPVAGARRR